MFDNIVGSVFFTVGTILALYGCGVDPGIIGTIGIGFASSGLAGMMRYR